MSEVVFTAEDLARVRLVATLGQTAEAVFALETFDRTSNSLFVHWRKQVGLGLAERTDPVRALARQLRKEPALVWTSNGHGRPVYRPVDSCGKSATEVADLVDAFRQVAVAPYWTAVRNYLEVERHAKSGLMAAGGVERLLATLNTKLMWDDHILELPDDDTGTVELRGRGLLVAPSVFLTRRAAVLIDTGESDEPPVLVFAAPPDAGLARRLWSGTGSPDTALSALIGRTRAAVLRAVSDGGATGELAVRLDISSAVVSQHASVLRQVGLIRTSRNGNTVLHTLTPLGMALLETEAHGLHYFRRFFEMSAAGQGDFGDA